MLYSHPAHTSVLTPLRPTANVALLFVSVTLKAGCVPLAEKNCHFWQSHLPL
jgi:hypothetical protein